MRIINSLKILELVELENKGLIKKIRFNEIRTGKFVETFICNKDFKVNNYNFRKGEYFQREF